jgi:hypothetical protein
MERFEAILELTRSDNKEVCTADEIEELLVEEVRRLGNRAMHEWASGAETRIAHDFEQTHPKARPGKKKL